MLQSELLLWLSCRGFFVVNQKTAYDVRISDWSSDVCSSDLVAFHAVTIVDADSEGTWITGLPAAVNLITVGQEYVAPGDEVRSVSEAEIDDKLKDLSS